MDRTTTAEPDLTELGPLVRIITDALHETPLTLGTPAGCADLAATIAVRVAVYIGREVLPPVSISPTAAYLATPCDACSHTLNWHRNDVGCTVPRCVCGRFHSPTSEARP
ncbi:hypothetical protein JK361_22670 [Streptomyces sp. 5-8]|uniref:Uncharacterized protein n=1 Tax=Streptomyces musisoli TaxID=2802280 RepID=A0ABS1P4T1_9ACTN|nr:hypothetical protein [Streptomyces musisoli]MBL1107374.1 hypothetical protein [Streptomyces musisoli]